MLSNLELCHDQIANFLIESLMFYLFSKQTKELLNSLKQKYSMPLSEPIYRWFRAYRWLAILAALCPFLYRVMPVSSPKFTATVPKECRYLNVTHRSKKRTRRMTDRISSDTQILKNSNFPCYVIHWEILLYRYWYGYF